jgi:hypothetical protein
VWLLVWKALIASNQDSCVKNGHFAQFDFYPPYIWGLGKISKIGACVCDKILKVLRLSMKSTQQKQDVKCTHHFTQPIFHYTINFTPFHHNPCY